MPDHDFLPAPVPDVAPPRLALIGGGAIVLLLGLLLTAMLLIRSYAPPAFYSESQKVWAHRGYVGDGLMENTIPAFRRAFELGAPGTELDIFFDQSRSRFVVTHDAPESFDHDDLLTLNDVFHALGNEHLYWLDFKNLPQLAPEQARTAVNGLLSLQQQHALADKLIVESTHAQNLSLFSRAGIPTSYWVMFDPDASHAKLSFYLWKVRLELYRGGFSALSMDHRQFTPRVESTFARIPIHLFTVNDPVRLDTLVSKENVRVILTDLNRYR